MALCQYHQKVITARYMCFTVLFSNLHEIMYEDCKVCVQFLLGMVSEGE